MKKNQSKGSSGTSGVSGIVLLEKKAGKTSFSSLSVVKRALSTSKVGHTGTLDSFADGLLVVLVGAMTHLVPHITNFDKTYLALIEFGSETDTLDPTGQVVKVGRIPSRKEVEAVLPKFLGEIEQVPPAYSALHVDGKRASDLMREGKSVELKARKITIHSICLKDFYDKYALVEVSCSKGTYIRSLARDIAASCASVAHLKELKRTRVGPFDLKDAVSEDNPEKIKEKLLEMNHKIASLCGMDSFVLSPAFEEEFSNGRPLKSSMFVRSLESDNSKTEVAVFYPDGKFAGVIRRTLCEKRIRLAYGFVIHRQQKMRIYSWEQIENGKFSDELKNKGVALTIGSFDGIHLGHRTLFESVLEQKNNGLVAGVLTFTKSLRSYKNPADYDGDVISISQKLEKIKKTGFDFVIVVDFSSQFAKIDGRDFLHTLSENCGLKFLSEGNDFHCGNQGFTGVKEIFDIAADLNFSFQIIDSVILNGERVSSSRIRKCILKKDFPQVKQMLSNPFEIDCTGFNWRVTKGQKTELSVKVNSSQILPPNGTYPVMVSFYENMQKTGEAQEYRAVGSDCTLENGNLRLAFSDNLISGFVRSIQFL